ncbi:uncharacterized protein Dwil_GK27296 [Drosophila willistoni]|uniref:WD repeat-containing protein 55 homolog n=2 Tax=Drosophila willistoni TaxID=7260 RepID=A0A0Q9X1Y0_DROWI|nr:uncharacterized protein Dwil_GK27296 [Drosophila willistoni]
MDTVLLLHENELTCTQFKDHANQRDITCMAFRSFTCFELAVGCAAGICLWSRNKDRYTLRMLTDKRHVYVTSLAWAENGLILISASLGCGNIIFWQPEMGEKMRFLLGGRNGFSLLSYTPDPGFIFYAYSDAGASFCKYDGMKLFEGTNILSEKRIQSSTWTQCGSHLFFVEKDSCLLYACVAFPDEGVVLDPDVLWKPQVVADLDRVTCSGQHRACGHIQSIAIDPLDIYMAIIFKNQPFVLICFLALSQVLPVRILPRNYVTYNGNSTEKEQVYPTCVKFTVCQSKPVRSLVIAWSTGQLQRLVYNAQSPEEALSRMSTNSNLNQLKWTNYLTIGYGPESEMVVFK